MMREARGKMVVALACVLAGAGCHRDGKSNDQRTASGQVLQGSVSDAMIPYEALKSRPPLAPREAVSSGRAAVTADSAASGDADSAGDAAASAATSAAAAASAATLVY